jgi:hypothetical protein
MFHPRSPASGLNKNLENFYNKGGQDSNGTMFSGRIIVKLASMLLKNSAHVSR